MAKGLKHKKGLFVVGEMGVGKTFLSIAVSQLINSQKTVVLCPTHLVKKWEREIKMVIPNAQVYDLNGMTISQILALRGLKPSVPTFFILGKEQAKLHYKTKFCEIKADKWGDQYVVCPKCGKKIYPKVTERSSKFQDKCEKCGEPLEYADNSGFRRYAKSLLLKKYFKFDLCIADEVHELKGGDTAQGQALANLTAVSKKVLALTGTLMGGYASNLFYLLWRVSPQTMIKLKIPYNGLKTFVERYGVIEKIDISESKHKASIGRKLRTTTKEKPGISPLLISEMLENSVFVKLTDISNALPPYKEEVVSVEMSDEQASIYNTFESSLMSHVRAALARGNKSLLGKMVQSLYALPDGARRGEVVYDSEQQPIAVAEGLNQYLLPKEQYLADIIQQEKAAGRKVLVMLEHTGTRDLMPDLKERIENLVPDVKVDLLYSTTTKKVEDREGWILDHENDVLITNPRLVQTGLDLYQYPTIVFFQTGYSIFTLRQASRRSWRIGQTQPVKVYYLSYSNSLQEKALKLIASKLETALAVEGDLSDKGLTALSEADNSILVELAKSLIEGEKATPDDVKDAWTKAVEKELINDTTMSKEHEIEQTETVATTTEVTTKVDDKSVATKFTVVSNVSVSNGKATFKFGGISYMLQNGKIYDESTKKVAGKYEWKHGKNDKYALCYIYNLKKKLYIGKQGNRFVALEIKKVG
jgi:SNF2 family DNA or RNA helicase